MKLLPLFLTLAICPLSFGAITYVGGTSPANSNGGTATTDPLDGHAGNWPIMWVGVTGPGPGSGSNNACNATVGDNLGNSYTSTVSDTGGASGCLFCPTGTPSVSSSMTFHAISATTGWTLVIGAVFAGVPSNYICNHTSHALNPAPDTTSIQPGSITANGPGYLFLTGVADYNYLNGTHTIDSGFSVVSQTGSNSVAPDGGLAYKIQTSGVTENPTWLFGVTNPGPAATMVVVEPPGGTDAPTVTLTTYNPPSWSTWASIRAGVCTGPQLDGSASHGNNAPSTTVTHFWQQLSGPTQVVWSSHTAAQPTFCGQIFGQYAFQDTVTDIYGNSASASITVGVVATDVNGVVVNANPAADNIFGPMIAFGSANSGWGYMDQQALYATTARLAAYTSQGINPPVWQTPGVGTVSYVWDGATSPIGSGGTTLAAAITSATQMTVDVADITKMDTTVLPTRILVGTNPYEEVRVCTKTQISGNHWQFGVCYDGRGWTLANNTGTVPATQSMTPAQAWSNGTSVGQFKATGSGTTFCSGSIAICPSQGGVAPYATGTVAYSTGTVNVTAGSATLVGVGTTWNGTTLPNNSFYEVRIQGTTSSTPFSFIAYVSSVNSTTGITMSRVFPADADSNSSNPGLTYQIIGITFTSPSLHYTNLYGADMQIVWGSVGCESDTQCNLVPYWDIPGLDGVTQSSMAWTIANKNGFIINTGSLGGVNFYGEDLAHCALWLRSGWTTALTACKAMNSMWSTSPYLAGGDTGGIPLFLGGGAIGGIMGSVLGISGAPTWSQLRSFLKKAENNIPSPGNCNTDDTRDLSYYFSWIALGAQYDAAYNSGEWATDLGSVYNWEVSCERSSATGVEHNSWANTGYGTHFVATVTLTGGGSGNTASGTGFTSGLCSIVGTGTIQVTNGSAAATVVTGSLSTAYSDTNGGQLIIEGSPGNGLPAWFGTYLTGGSSSVTLSTQWSGASNTYTFFIESSQQLLQIGTGPDDISELVKTWGCAYISSTLLVLDRPWDGSSGNFLLGNSERGYSQQPYMMGLKTHELTWASQATTANSAGFAALANDAATWVKTYGYDTVTQGMYYLRVQQACESAAAPLTTPPVSPLFQVRTPFCNYGLGGSNPTQPQVARNLMSEGAPALAVYYTASGQSSAAKTFGDTAYGSLYCGINSAGFYTVPDGQCGGSNMNDPYLQGEKYPGLFFGMGMAHQWPAARLGGVQPVANRTVVLAATPTSGGSLVCNVIAPSSATSQASGSNTCTFTVDDRMASAGKSGYQVQIVKKNSGGSVVATGPWQAVN